MCAIYKICTMPEKLKLKFHKQKSQKSRILEKYRVLIIITGC